MNSGPANGATPNRVGLVVPAAPAREASLEQLQEWIGDTFRVQNQVAAVRAEYLNELRRREGRAIAETVLREDGLLSPRRARQEMETATELENLPQTREGLRRGDISPDNARILAAANQRGPISEDELIHQAKSQSPDRFARTVRRHERDRAADNGVKRLEHQQKQRFANIKVSLDDGMTVLYGRFDPITGAKIKTVLSHTMKQLWHEEDPQDRVTPGQRMADALEILLTRPDQKKGKGGYQGVRLLLMADYDTIGQQLRNGRSADGTPIPAQTLRQPATPKSSPPSSREVRNRWTWAEPDERPTPPNAPPWSPETNTVSAAEPKPSGAKHTISPIGNTEDPPTWTTCACYAADATTGSTTKTGK